ncbi:hypothetical protein DFH09DRAFT_957797, partial [Mycena vulgaris]
MSHVCNRGCGQSIFVFKAISRPRINVDTKFSKGKGTNSSSLADRELDRKADKLLREKSPVLDPTPSDISHLAIADGVLRTRIIREWQEQTSTAALELKTCAACGKCTSAAEISQVDAGDVDLKILRNDALPALALPTSYNFAAYDRAILCSVGLSNTEKPDKLALCTLCVKSLKSNEMPKLALANWLYYGREALPDQVREAFDQASLFERMLICRVRYNSVCCRFKASDYDPTEEEETQKFVLRNARKGVRGNVMVTPLDVVRLNNVLPPSPELIRDTMSVVFIGTVPPTRQTISKLSPVLVRKSRVKTMIEFLLANNPHYGPLQGFKGYSAENLNRLFDSVDAAKDEAVPCAVYVGHLAPNDAVDSATADYTRRNVDEEYLHRFSEDVLMENVGYTLGDESPASYRDMKLRALEKCLAGHPYLGSQRGGSIVKDFDNPYLMSMAFPEEDPWGIGGMLHPQRRKKISPAEQVAHLLTVHGGRFQRHSEFAFFYYNVLRKQLVATNTRYKAPKNNYRDVVDKMLNVDLGILSSLKEKCKRDALYIPTDETEKHIMTLMNSVGLIARHIPGSAGHKVKLRNEIRGLINYRGAPTLFVTLNPSDIDNPIVRLFAGEDIDLEDLARGEDMDGWQRRIFAARNPAACALFFDLIITKFIDIVLRYGKPGRGLFG